MLIAEINESDIPASADIIRRSFLTVAGEFGLTRENAPTNGAFIEDEKLLGDFRKGIKMFGLFEGGEQAGFAALERKDAKTFYLEKLAVLPERRHNGYGGKLIEFAKDYVGKAGGEEISIGIIYENKLLLEWYKAYGFEETGTKVFAHLPFTVCFMAWRIGGIGGNDIGVNTDEEIKGNNGIDYNDGQQNENEN